jgi:integrase
MTRRNNGEGSIGRRKDGSYYGAIEIAGKRQWVSGKTRKEVSEKIQALRQKHEHGIDLDAKHITIGDFMRRWLSEVVSIRNKHRTAISYEKITEQHIIPVIGQITLADLRPDHVQKLINELCKRKAPRTVRNVRAVLRRALNQAMRWRYITFNAAALVDLPRCDDHKIEPLSVDEARLFLSTIKGHRLEALYTLTLLIGLREGEVLGLLVSNIDFEKNTITIDGALQYQNSKLIRTSTKTKASMRTLPIPITLLPLLRSLVASAQSEYLFTSTCDTPINPRNLVRQFKALLVKAQIRVITLRTGERSSTVRFHDLRHSCATFLIAAGVHPRTIMSTLGHSTISTTMNIYGHTLDETHIEAISRIDRLLLNA